MTEPASRLKINSKNIIVKNKGNLTLYVHTKSLSINVLLHNILQKFQYLRVHSVEICLLTSHRTRTDLIKMPEILIKSIVSQLFY